MPFNFKQTPIESVTIIQPRKFGDDRGFFMETYKKSDFVAQGINEEFCHPSASTKKTTEALNGLW
jgi:dTDP-4-dehydrorhamnose 3,5-epimerase